MDQIFAFKLATYRPDAPTKVRVGAMASSGSQETRARRRLLDHLHGQGWFVKAIECVGSQPAQGPDSL